MRIERPEDDLAAARLLAAGWRRSFRATSDPSIPESDLFRWRDPANPFGASLTLAQALSELQANEKR